MPVVTSGNTATLTLGAYDSITLQNRAGQSASLTIAGVLVNGAHSGTRTYGPYAAGGAVSITATAGDVYYETADGRGFTKPVEYTEEGPTLTGDAAGAVAGQLPVVLNARAAAVLGALQIYCDALGRGRVVGNPRHLVPMDPRAYTNQFYVNRAAANDSGDGLTWATAKQKISSALTLGNASNLPYTVNVAAGVYNRNWGFTGVDGAGTVTPTQACVIQAVGGPVICHVGGDLTWTLESGTTYQATRSNVCRVLDFAARDADGEFVELQQVTTLAACRATPGSWFTDNTTVYVNRSDAAAPTNANTTAMLLNVGGIRASTGGNTHLIGIQQYGGGAGALYIAGSGAYRVYAEDCRFAFTTRADNIDCVQSLDLDLFVGVRCIASHGQKDGFNFHTASGVIPKALLIDSLGFENGSHKTTIAGANSCNGATMHDGGLLIDVNGRWYRNHGGDAAHVNAGTEAWHIGTQAYRGYGDLDRASGVTPPETGYLAGDSATVRLVGSLGKPLATTGGTITGALA